MRSDSRILLLVTLSVLCACGTDFAAPENTGVFTVDLAIKGSPATPEGSDNPNFQLNWRHPESDFDGTAPINPQFTPKEFSQVPVGRVLVTLSAHPGNCSVADESQEIEVARADTARLTFHVECSS